MRPSAKACSTRRACAASRPFPALQRHKEKAARQKTAHNLRGPVEGQILGWMAACRDETERDRRVEMAARDGADCVGHSDNCQAAGQRNAEPADPDIGRTRRENCAAAAPEYQPESAVSLGQSFL